MTSAIIHLVPRLTPALCGVGDYATLVGGRIEELNADVRCGYVACGHLTESPYAGGIAHRNVTGTCDPTNLWRAVSEIIDELAEGVVDRVSLLVHYSGYGYAVGGAPVWLVEALERRPQQFSLIPIISMFHELYATGWPWQRAFWYSTRQRKVAVRLARISDFLVTNRQQSMRWLERVTGSSQGSSRSLPMPSNIGEPSENQPWSARSSQAVTFGGARFKRPFLEGSGAVLTAQLCRKLEIRRLVNIGARATVDDATFRASGIKIVQAGFLPAHDASECFAAARIAFADYFSGYYAKSSVLAAAAAHGTPLIFPHDGVATDGLRFGEQLWDLKSALSSSCNDTSTRLASMSRSLRAWYDGHSSEQHARLFAVAFLSSLSDSSISGAMKAG
jgi:hypothetical protein